jgi:hypothetical protein
VTEGFEDLATVRTKMPVFCHVNRLELDQNNDNGENVVNTARNIRFPTQTETREQTNMHNLLRSSWFPGLLSWIASSDTEPLALSASKRFPLQRCLKCPGR